MAADVVGPHRRRAGMLFAVLALTLGLLTACTKPLPEITVYGNGKSIIVPAASYQFANGPRHNKITDFGQAPTLHVQQGTQLLVDVPHSIAVHEWLVSAITLDDKSKSTGIPGVSSAVHGKHVTRLATVPANVTDYYLQIVEYRDTATAGGWVLHVVTEG